MSKVGIKVMLAVDLDIKGHLINGKTGNIRHNESAQGSACKAYVKFSDKQSGSKAMLSSYLGRQISWVPIEKFVTKI